MNIRLFDQEGKPVKASIKLKKSAPREGTFSSSTIHSTCFNRKSSKEGGCPDIDLNRIKKCTFL